MQCKNELKKMNKNKCRQPSLQLLISELGACIAFLLCASKHVFLYLGSGLTPLLALSSRTCFFRSGVGT